MIDTSGKSEYSTVSHRSGSSLFLLELIIAVGFFAVAGVVCINMFLHAHRVSAAAREKTEAVRISQNCAECFLAADGDDDEFHSLLQKAFPEAALSEKEAPAAYELFFSEGGYRAILTVKHTEDNSISGSEPHLNTLHIGVNGSNGEEVYHLDVSDFSQKGGSS